MKKILLLSMLFPFLMGCNQVKPTKKITGLLVNDMTTVYEVNSKFEFDGIATAIYSDESTSRVTPTSIVEPDLSILGTQEVRINYEENNISVYATYDIIVSVKPEVQLISISIEDSITEYRLNEEFAFKGKLIATYSDNSTKEVVPTSVSKVDTTTIGKKKVTVLYEEGEISKTATYEIEIYAEITHFELKEEVKNIYSWFSDEQFLSDEYCYDEEGKYYYFSFEVGYEISLASKYSLINDVVYLFDKESYSQVIAPQEFVWENESVVDVEAAYVLNPGFIYIEFATFEDETLGIEIHVMPSAYVKLINSYTYTFLDCPILGSLDQPSKLVEFNNHLKDNDGSLLIDLSMNGYAQVTSLPIILNESIKNHSALILGSKNSDCEMIFSFSKQIKSISFAYQNYHKYIEYNSTWSIDKESVLNIQIGEDNIKTIDLTIEEGALPLVREDKINFSEGVNCFSYQSTSGRVLLHSLTINY